VDTVADDRPDMAALVRPSLHPVPWVVALGLGVVVAARWVAFGTPTARELVGGLLAIAVPAIVVGACVERGRPVVAAAVVLACCSTVLAAASDGRWQGVAALVTVALAAWSDRREAATALGLVSIVAVVMWWRSGFDRGDAPGPSWREVVGETGSVVRRAVSSVGTDELLVPLSGVLLWWFGIGLVVGAALLARRIGRAAWVPISVVVFVLGVWAIRLWRGSVDPIAGTWIVVTGLVLAAGRPTDDSTDDSTGARRTAVLVMVIAGLVMAIAFVHELRPHSTFAAIAAGAGATLVGVSLAAEPVLARVSGRAGAGRDGRAG
jgi:hypothetical protein